MDQDDVEDQMSQSVFLPKVQTQNINNYSNDDFEHFQQLQQNDVSSQQPRIVQSYITEKIKTSGDEEELKIDFFMSQSNPQQLQHKNQFEELLLQQKMSKSIFALNPNFDESKFTKQIREASVQFCISSPATRSLFSNTEKVKSRTTLVQNTKKIWLENQCDCFHSMFETKALRILIKCESTKIPRVELLSQFHSDNLQEFVVIFCKLPEVRDSIFSSQTLKETSISDQYGINQGYSEVINALSEYMRSNYPDEKDTTLIDDMTERYLTRMIYEKLYPKEPTARDIELNMKFKTLEWITDDHLSIKLKQKVSMYEYLKDSAQLINEIDNQKNSVDKLDCLLKATSLVSEAISQINQEAASADAVFPAFIRVLIYAQPQRLQSNINFIELFINKSRMMSNSGYCFTQLKSAVVWIENLDHEQLKMDKQIFNRLVQEKIVKYGMCKQRKRTERIRIF